MHFSVIARSPAVRDDEAISFLSSKSDCFAPPKAFGVARNDNFGAFRNSRFLATNTAQTVFFVCFFSRIQVKDNHHRAIGQDTAMALTFRPCHRPFPPGHQRIETSTGNTGASSALGPQGVGGVRDALLARYPRFRFYKRRGKGMLALHGT
ncbi:MAG: hypothetical protein HY564_02535 [Candidatus Jacksonbacteria bacterium]|nr:hypothetical protein [Candidatus Jacksonbacteria bacterium]